MIGKNLKPSFTKDLTSNKMFYSSFKRINVLFSIFDEKRNISWINSNEENSYDSWFVLVISY